ERSMRPIERRAGGGYLFGAQGRAMSRRGSGLSRRAISDYGAAGDQRRARIGLCRLARGGNRLGITAIDGLDVPALGRETLLLVVGDRQAGRAVDGNLVVVPQHDQAAESEVSGEGNGLVADAFHQTAVARDHIGVM